MTSGSGKAPNLLLQSVVGWRASRIADPVARLHFLRHTIGDRASWQELRRHRSKAMAVGAAVLLLPAGAITAGGLLWNRAPLVAADANAKDAGQVPQVWQVDQNKDFELYSNGLRIERQYEVTNEPRSFDVYRRGDEGKGPVEARTAPAGIVFHTTESQQPEFKPESNRRIQYIGAVLLDFVRTERAYHYVVDRFGRVWRIVRESDSANHAGYSVWADRQWTYISLNRAFLGISVEAQTQPGSEHAVATPAQMHSLRILTEMLRSKYKIAASDCATHAQVSVNPDNMQAGYHTDWAANFPFAEVGLPNNYMLPMPSLWLFGFNYDVSLMKVTGEPFWKGLKLGEEQLKQNATAHGMSVQAYRQELSKRYRQVLMDFKAKTEKSKEKQG